MKLIRLVLYITFITSLLSCSKNDDEQQPDQQEGSLPPQISIGSYEEMQVQYFDTLIVGLSQSEYAGKEFNIDIDNDGIDDLQFVSINQFSNGTGFIKSSEVHCLNDAVSLLGISEMDSLWSNRDTLLFENENNQFTKIYRTNTVCNSRSSSDSLLGSIESFRVEAKDSLDIISVNENFQNTSVMLTDEAWSLMPNYLGVNGDTTYYETSSFDYSCDDFPSEEVKYIGLIFMDKLGWVKIKIHEGYQIRIIEIAIQ